MNGPEAIKVKVCGMKEPDNIRAIGRLHPDYMGFIFYKSSGRFVGENFKIPSDLPSTIKRVGVFVDQGLDEITRIAGEHKLEYIQLHGHESAATCLGLRKTGLKVIKAFPIDEHFNFNDLNEFSEAVDYFLFDTKGKYAGGNGIPFDWSLLGEYKLNVPYFLSGGLSPENIPLLGRKTSRLIHALDVNSGVEVSVGVKDVRRVSLVMTEKDSIEGGD